MDAVVHAAGVMDFYPQDEAAEARQWAINVNGTAAVFAAARMSADANATTLPPLAILLSSTETVGASSGGDETQELNPAYAYGRSKAAAEAEARKAGLPLIVLRPTGVLGPGDTFAMFELMASVWAGLFALAPTGTDTAHLQFTHVADVVQATLRALRAGGCATGNTRLGALASSQRSGLPPTAHQPGHAPAVGVEGAMHAAAGVARVGARADRPPLACTSATAAAQTLNATFNVSPPDSPTLLDWFVYIAEAAGRQPPPVHVTLPLPALRGLMAVVGPVVRLCYPPTFFYQTASIDRCDGRRRGGWGGGRKTGEVRGDSMNI